ncbi:anaerobic dimethyl sulfoxide reductase subunit A [Salmonella enterica subsp. enterica]|nr:anaerobic dimethyl sulfoxide reductase subunit A [Salmonella enterica subsp. enterica]
MKTKIPDAVLAAEVSRRGLVKTTAIGGLAMASSAFTLPFTRIANAAEAISPTKTDEKVVWSACTVNCGSRCPLRMHVVDGEIKYVETDNTGNDDYDGLHQVRACLRGRSMRRRVYNPDRLKYPMKRVGARGEGKFERISWDEAYDIIGHQYAASYQRVWQRVHLSELWHGNAGRHFDTFMAARKNAGRSSDELLRRLS